MSFIQQLKSLAAGLLLTASFAAPVHAQAPASAPEASAPAPTAAPAATPEPAAPAAPPSASVSKESVENPYDLKHLWAQGDVVARGTLIILIIMSAASWYILVTKLFESFKLSAE